MFELILSIIFSTLLANLSVPYIGNNFFLQTPAISQQQGGDQVGENKLPQAADKPIPQKINQNSLGVEVTARSGVVIDWESGEVLWEKNSFTQQSIASLTKLMTALVFLEYNPGWEKKVTVTAEDQREGGAAFFVVGDEVTVRDLFYVTLVRSINCSAAALVRSTGLAEGDFVKAMNQKAKDLGLKNTNFVDPTGLEVGNISNAQEVAILLQQALNNNAIANATTLSSHTAKILNKNENRVAQNTDWLLGSFLNQKPYQIVGGKTGYLDEAGYCLSLGVEREGKKVISVVLGSDSLENRFNDTKGLIDWVFRNYSWE
jgi:D-alanyl-D-alanine carboxypeptidase